MAEIINLRRERKARKRQANEADAAANRVLHGRSKGERLRQELEAEQARKSLDQHRLDRKEP